MFEKEAEEWVVSNTEIYDDKFGIECETEPQAKEAYIAGAEFGYNKAKEDADKMKRQFLELCKLKDMRIKELEKTNEWHYPSKGEYPKEFENVWCYCKGAEIKFCCVGHTIVNGDNKVRWWANNKSEELRVIAWNEIILPKEIE